MKSREEIAAYDRSSVDTRHRGKPEKTRTLIFQQPPYYKYTH